MLVAFAIIAEPTSAPIHDHRLAARLAVQTGRLLLDLRQRLQSQDAPRTFLQDEGDRLAHEHLMEQLHRARPADAVLSEEGTDDKARLSAHRTWIIDPLDGTRQFAQQARTDWGVHVGLVINNYPCAGAVALPALGLLFSSADTPAPMPHVATADRPLRVIASRSRPPKAAIRVAKELQAELVQLGAAGAKAMAVVRGECDIYVHSGGQYEWDSCAPVAVAVAARCHVSRLNGEPLRYNQPDPYLPDILICRPELAAATLNILASEQ